MVVEVQGSADFSPIVPAGLSYDPASAPTVISGCKIADFFDVSFSSWAGTTTASARTATQVATVFSMLYSPISESTTYTCGRDSPDQIFHLGAAFGPDGEAIDAVPRERGLQALVHLVPEPSSTENLHTDDAFARLLHLAKYGDDGGNIGIHCDPGRIDAR